MRSWQPFLGPHFCPTYVHSHGARLYAMYNNLLFINLASFDPGTYNVLIQLKIALTGVLLGNQLSSLAPWAPATEVVWD